MSGGAIAGIVLGVFATLTLIVAVLTILNRFWPLWRFRSILRGDIADDTVTLDIALDDMELEERNYDIGIESLA